MNEDVSKRNNKMKERTIVHTQKFITHTFVESVTHQQDEIKATALSSPTTTNLPLFSIND